MFCYQCEQTAGCSGCTGKIGVCGKTADIAALQDELTGALIGLAGAAEGGNSDQITGETNGLMVEGLFATLTNVNFDGEVLQRLCDQVRTEKERIAAGGGKSCEYDMDLLWKENEDIRSLKSLVLFGLRGMAAYAYHARILGYEDQEVMKFFYEGLFRVEREKTMEALLPVVMKVGEINLKCMELLDRANTESFGVPSPVEVSMEVEKGPFIVISGHDLYDLKMLLEQTEGKGIMIYTHGEMLPAHGYPELKKYSHLKGNFGTAWQNQQKEFAGIPAPVLFTTNCIMPVKESYSDRVYTTGTVAYPGMVHIGADGSGKKDFTPVIERALALGGYGERQQFSGINGGTSVTTGFGYGAVLQAAGQVVEAVKAGTIRHFFLVGGCDGARAGRNYYTEFVKQAPEDSMILTLACGKYRFNDLKLGNVGGGAKGLPRLMDMGQCNDAFGAVQVAKALAGAFSCGINELPLTLVLSWYEQKAVCILLSLLYLGMKGIYLGPTLPAFLSKNVLGFLVKNYDIRPISTPEKDLREILG